MLLFPERHPLSRVEPSTEDGHIFRTRRNKLANHTVERRDRNTGETSIMRLAKVSFIAAVNPDSRVIPHNRFLHIVRIWRN